MVLGFKQAFLVFFLAVTAEYKGLHNYPYYYFFGGGPYNNYSIMGPKTLF